MKSLQELKAMRERMGESKGIRTRASPTKITVAMGTCGIAAGARSVLLAIMGELAETGLRDTAVTQTGCLGMCEREPLVEVVHQDHTTLYAYVNAERARQIVRDLLSTAEKEEK
ncbi:MAG: NADP-reducing hydrogenase subunit HndB [Firmicutes bacterium]|nr:NADP-reducing hydrogenase subunit HndB [Bacillota bacterium]